MGDRAAPTLVTPVDGASPASSSSSSRGLRPPRSPPLESTMTPAATTDSSGDGTNNDGNAAAGGQTAPANLHLDLSSPHQAQVVSALDSTLGTGASAAGAAGAFSVPSTPISPARVLHTISTQPPQSTMHDPHHHSGIQSPASHMRSTSTPSSASESDSGPTSPEFISPDLIALTLQQQRSLQGVPGAPTPPNSTLARAASIRARMERSATMSARSNQPRIGSPILTSARGIISPQRALHPAAGVDHRPLSLRITSPQADGRHTPNRPSMSTTAASGLPIGLMRRPSSLRHQRAPSSLTPAAAAPRPSMLLRRASVGPLTATHSMSSTPSTQQNIMFAMQQQHQLQQSLSRPSMSTRLSRQGSGKNLTLPAAGTASLETSSMADEPNPFERENEAPTPHFNPAYAMPTQQHHARFASMAGFDMSDLQLSTADLLAASGYPPGSTDHDLLASVEEIDLGTAAQQAQERQQAEKAEFKRIMRLELVFIYLFFLSLVCNLDGGSIPASLVNLKRDFPTSTYAALGAFSSVNIFGLLIGGAASGWLLDEFSQQGLLAGSLCLQALFVFLFGIVHDVGFMTFARFVIGLTQGPLIVFIPDWVRWHAPSLGLHATWNTLLHVASPLGMSIGYIVGIICSLQASSNDASGVSVDSAADTSAYAWKWAFLVQSFILAPMALVLFLVPRDLLSTRPEEREKRLLEQRMQAEQQQQAQFGQMLQYQQAVLRDEHRPSALHISGLPAAVLRSVASARGTLQPPRPSPFASALSAPSTMSLPIQGSPQWRRSDSDGSVALAPSSVTIAAHHQAPFPSPSYGVGGIEITSSPLSSTLASGEFAQSLEDEPSPETLPLFDTQELASIFTPRHRIVAWSWSPSARSDHGLWTHEEPDPSLSAWAILQGRVSELKDSLRILLTNWLYVSMVLSLCFLFFLLAGLHFWVTPYLVATYTLDLSIVGLAYVLIAFIATPCGVVLGRHAMQQIEARLDARYDRELAEPSHTSSLHPADDDSDDRTGPMYDTIGRKSRQLTKQIFALMLACASGIGVGCLVIGFAVPIGSPSVAFVFLFLVLLLGGVLVPCCAWILDGAAMNLESIPIGLSASFSQLAINLLGYFLAPIAIGGAMDSGGMTSGFQLDLIWSALLLSALASAGVLQWRECAHQRTLEDVQRAVHMTIGSGVDDEYEDTYHDDDHDNPALSPRVRHAKNGESMHFNSINPPLAMQPPQSTHPQRSGSASYAHGRVSSTESVSVTVASDELPPNASGPDWYRRGSVVSYDAPMADSDVVSQSVVPSQSTTPLDTQYDARPISEDRAADQFDDIEAEELSEADETYLYGRAMQNDA